MHQTSTSKRYAIGRVRVVNAVSVNEVKRIVERNERRRIGVADPSDYWAIAAQEWEMVTLSGRRPDFRPISRSWFLPSEHLSAGQFIPFRVVVQPTTRKKLGPWFKIYGLIELSDLWLWSRLWLYNSEFPRAVLGLDRLQRDIFLHESSYL